MTRKDYQKFAELFGKVRAERSAHTGGMLDREELSAINHIEEAVMALFMADNPLFDEDKFVKAISDTVNKVSIY